MRHLFFVLLAIAATASPALAQTWSMTSIILPDGTPLQVDTTSVKRNWKKREQISYRIQVQSWKATAVGRIAGNCKTGTWQLTSNKSDGGLVLSQDVGSQSLRYACTLSYTMTQPKTR
jgi:hypothetical protein